MAWNLRSLFGPKQLTQPRVGSVVTTPTQFRDPHAEWMGQFGAEGDREDVAKANALAPKPTPYQPPKQYPREVYGDARDHQPWAGNAPPTQTPPNSLGGIPAPQVATPLAAPPAAVTSPSATTPIAIAIPKATASAMSTPQPPVVPLLPGMSSVPRTTYGNAFQAADPLIQKLRQYGGLRDQRPLTAGVPTNEQAAQTQEATAKVGAQVGLPGYESKITAGGDWGRTPKYAQTTNYDPSAAMNARTPIEGALARSGNTGKWLDGQEDTLGFTWRLNPANGKVEKQPKAITSPTPASFSAAQDRVNQIQNGRSENQASNGYTSSPDGSTPVSTTTGPVATPVGAQRNVGNAIVRGGSMQDGGSSFTRPVQPAGYGPSMADRLKAVQAKSAERAALRDNAVRVNRYGPNTEELAASRSPDEYFRALAKKMEVQGANQQGDADRALRRDDMGLREKLGFGKLKVEGDSLSAQKEEAKANRLHLADIAQWNNKTEIEKAKILAGKATQLDPEQKKAIGGTHPDPYERLKSDNEFRVAAGQKPDLTDPLGLTPERQKAADAELARVKQGDWLHGASRTLDKHGDLMRRAVDGGLTNAEEEQLTNAGVTPELLDQMANHKPVHAYDNTDGIGMSVWKALNSAGGLANETEDQFNKRSQRQSDARALKAMLENAKKNRAAPKPAVNDATSYLRRAAGMTV